MYVSNVYISGFKRFGLPTNIILSQGMNVIVGDNGSGKSTVLEAIHMVLSGTYRGRPLAQALTQDLFNNDLLKGYFDSLEKGEHPAPPEIRIEATLCGDAREIARFQGDGGASKSAAAGIGIVIELDEDEFGPEFSDYMSGIDYKALPIEYYRFRRYTFARDKLVASALKLRSTFVDSSGGTASGGQRSYISHLAKDVLDAKRQISVLQAHRRFKGAFDESSEVKSANVDLLDRVESLSGKSVTISADPGNRRAWESDVRVKLDSCAFEHCGSGSQCMAAVELALAKIDRDYSGIVLMEEPESHLTHANLNRLLSGIEECCGGTQVLVSTHSSFVANKLGLRNLSILGPDGCVSGMSNLKEETARYFSKIAGYDTLRLVLCGAAILVEGDSDELVVQRAYMDTHGNRLPIQDGLDVISVGTSFLRFLELADITGQPVVVVTDNDGDVDARRKKFDGYRLLCDEGLPTGDEPQNIAVSFPGRLLPGGDIDDYNYNTLEPELYEANGLERLNEAFGKSYASRDAMLSYMKGHKTDCALAVFEANPPLRYPAYIHDAIEFIDALKVGAK